MVGSMGKYITIIPHSFAVFLSFRDTIIQQCRNLQLTLLLELQLKDQELFHLIWAEGELYKGFIFNSSILAKQQLFVLY